MTNASDIKCRSSHYFKKSYFRCLRELSNNIVSCHMIANSSVMATGRLRNVLKKIFSYAVVDCASKKMTSFEKYESLLKNIADAKCQLHCWKMALRYIRGPRLDIWMKKIRIKRKYYMHILAGTEGDCKSFVSELRWRGFKLNGRDAWEMIKWPGSSSREMMKMHNLIMMFSKQKQYANRQIIDSIQHYEPRSKTYLEQYYFSRLKFIHKTVKWKILYFDWFDFIENSYLSRNHIGYFANNIHVTNDNNIYEIARSPGWIVLLMELANIGNIAKLQLITKRLKDCVSEYDDLTVYETMKITMSSVHKRSDHMPGTEKVATKLKTMTKSARKLFHDVTGLAIQ